MRDIISDAIRFATDAFEGKKRKCSGDPSILHAVEAASIVSSMTEDADIISAAVLHDTVEDAGISIETIRERFGERVAELVSAETEDKRRGIPAENTWRARKEESIRLLQSTDDIGVKLIFMGDKLSNMRAIRNDLRRCGDAVWQKFNQKDPNEQRWYYQTIAQALSQLSEYPAWQEYDQLIRQIFH